MFGILKALANNGLLRNVVAMAIPQAKLAMTVLGFFDMVKKATGETDIFKATLRFFTDPQFKDAAKDYERVFNKDRDAFVGLASWLQANKVPGGMLLINALNLPKAS
jgi:hypothetical protein